MNRIINIFFQHQNESSVNSLGYMYPITKNILIAQPCSPKLQGGTLRTLLKMRKLNESWASFPFQLQPQQVSFDLCDTFSCLANDLSFFLDK